MFSSESLHVILNHNSICFLFRRYSDAYKANLPEELNKKRRLLFKLPPASSSWTEWRHLHEHSVFVCVCKSDKGEERENPRKWPNISTVVGLRAGA